MRRQWKGFVSGIVVALILVGVIGNAAATVGSVKETLYFSNINVTMNGKAVNLVDANGDPVEPFIIDGTTYIPVRAVANALGLDVGWDGRTSTVILTSKTSMDSGTVIMDKNGIKISFIGFEEYASVIQKGWLIKLQIENTSGKSYTVQARDVSANGIMADESFSCTVANGKIANDSIFLYNLEYNGITPPITEAEFYFYIYSSDDNFESDVISIK